MLKFAVLIAVFAASFAAPNAPLVAEEEASEQRLLGTCRRFNPETREFESRCAEGETCERGLCSNRAAGASCILDRQCASGTCNRDGRPREWVCA